jgi:4-diphosphocytidyl-2-C-methyl-D-erythritol kinase
VSDANLRWWPAPAKLNLFLHVTGRRPDGFHNLQTLFQLLDWGDELAFEATDDGRLERIRGPAGLPATSDLCLRAAAALQRATGTTRGVRIRLHKRIPVGGGLGGGSSDAATTLAVLDRLWGTGLGVEGLAQLGLELGSDVPVFVRGSSAWGEGRGEWLTAHEGLGGWFLVLHPGIAVGTAEIFQAPELTRNSPVITIRAFSLAGTRNDCEAVVRARHPEVGAALDWMHAAGLADARLSGTGSCLYAHFAQERDALRVAERVPAPWRAYVARGVARSPLAAMLEGG